MAIDQRFGQSQLQAQFADLIFKEFPQGFDQLKIHPVGQAAHVVVGFDGLAGTFDRDRFDDIGIEGALGQKLDPFVLFGLLLKHFDKGMTDDFSLALGVGDAGQLDQKVLGGIDGDERHFQMNFKDALHLLPLPFSKQSVVDEDGNELIADRFIKQRRDDGAVDSSGEGAKYFAVPHLLADFGDLLLQKRAHIPLFAYAADFAGEVAQHDMPLLAVVDLRVKLQGVDLSLFVGDGGIWRVVAVGDGLEAFGQLLDPIGVAHPNHGTVVAILKKRASMAVLFVKMELRFAVFVVIGADHPTAEIDGDALHPVADPQNRQPQIVDRFVDLVGILVIHRSGSAAENDSFGIFGFDLFDFGEVGNDFAVDLLLPQAAGDKLSILRSEIQNDDADIFQGASLAKSRLLKLFYPKIDKRGQRPR